MTMAGIHINRTTGHVADLLPRDISTEIGAKAIEQSTVRRLARRINLPAGGTTIPIITGDPEADWVEETAEKPVSDSAIGSKNIRGYKMAVIETFSMEFRRDLPGLYNELARRLPQALGRKFDQTVINSTAPGSDFDVLTGAPAVVVDTDDTPGDFLNAYQTVGLAGGSLDGWALSPQAEALAMQARDANGNYLFVPNPQDGGSVGRIWGQPVYKSNAVYQAGDPATLGIAGDWTSAIVGVISDVQVAISDSATVNKGGTQLNLWQRNMFAIRAEFEVGFAVRDINHFVKLTGAASGGE